mmetsp:Transcript_9900/g.16992  ORF Transcript_9900/g.16992 Transcript_9900/m.16992 type:complete len:406 (-) Transcript_9900:148-1365(-)
MSYVSKCALLTVAIALAAFIPACDAFAHQKITTGAFKSMAARLMNKNAQGTPGRQLEECGSGEYLTMTCSAMAEDKVETILMKNFNDGDATCSGTPERETNLTAAEFTELSGNTVNMVGCHTINVDDDTVTIGEFKCRSNIIQFDVYSDSMCTNLVMTAPAVGLDACNCQDDDDDDADECTETCVSLPANCTEFGTFLSTGCAATCMASDLTTFNTTFRQAYLLGQVPIDLSTCTAELAALALKVPTTSPTMTPVPTNVISFVGFSTLDIAEFEVPEFNTTFRTSFVAQLAAAASVPTTAVSIDSITSGSVLVSATTSLPSATAAATFQAALDTTPATVFTENSFATYGVVTSTSTTEATAPSPTSSPTTSVLSGASDMCNIRLPLMAAVLVGWTSVATSYLMAL